MIGQIQWYKHSIGRKTFSYLLCKKYFEPHWFLIHKITENGIEITT